MKQPLVVLKFGSSVLSSCDRLPAAAHEVYRHYRLGCRVVVVVSAIGRHTNLLMDEAESICTLAAPDTAVAQLLSTGEQRAAALLAMTLCRAGIQSESVDVFCANLVLAGDRLDASPTQLNAEALHRKLDTTPVLVLPGFIGCHELGGMALMGRGGSDLTAVFLADRLQAAECRLVKDVDGIYERDPATPTGGNRVVRPNRYGQVTYERALEVAEVLVQRKAIEYLQARGNKAKVSALLHTEGTVVGSSATIVADTRTDPPMKVLLLGLGAVGHIVHRQIQEMSEFFDLVGIHVNEAGSHVDEGVPVSLLHTDVYKLSFSQYDIVVDVRGDSLAQPLIESSLAAGVSVVTVSKQISANHGVALNLMAKDTGASFRYSAAVGGSAPMLERVGLAAKNGSVISMRGVLSGVCNFIFDQIAHGATFEAAVTSAQELGFAGSDVSRDIDGQDSEDQLRLLARAAFGSEFDGFPVTRVGMEVLSPADFGLAKLHKQTIRLVATIRPGEIARIAPEFLGCDDFLGSSHGEESRLTVAERGGNIWHIQGKGADAWPIAEAVIADMLDVYLENYDSKANSPRRVS